MHRTRARSLAVLAATATMINLPAAVTAQQPAELVIVNARVFTSDPVHPRVQAVAIRDGRFVAVGDANAVAALIDASTRVIDARGRVVVPGFNDAHMHIGPGDDAVAVRFGSNDPTASVIGDSVRAAAARTPSGTWLSGAIGETALAQAAETRALLDRVAPDHPVRLEGWTGHGLILNRAGLARAGIDERAADPAGGWFQRAADGSITAGHGYAKFNEDVRSIAVQSDSMARDAIARQATEAAALGITTIQGMPLPLEPARLQRLASALDLPLRLSIIRMGDPAVPANPIDRAARVSDRLTTGGVKWFADGTPVERNALLSQPYGDRAGWHGRAYLDAAVLGDAARAAVASGTQPAFHASGDSTIALIFAALRAAAPDSVWRRLRPRIEHGDFLRRDQLDDARRLGVVLVQNPAHLMTPDVLAARFGSRVGDMQLLASVQRAGVALAIGSDGPVNPFLNLMFVTMHPGNPAEALSMEQAVVAYTYGSAYAEGIDDKGMIAVGMLADLAVLSQDIFAVPAQALPATTSVLTIVGGRIVHEATEAD
ncbi:MAG TPA: amidohydrolase [Longimicrobiales bacterium]